MKRPTELRAAWPALAKRLKAAHAVAVMLDFDGTLAPIVPHPDQARLPRRTRAALQRLRQRPKVEVGIVSGRSLADVRERVGLAGLHYVGSHGLEWQGPTGKGRLRVKAGARAAMRKIGEVLKAQLKEFQGLYVEQKTTSVTVHYRNASAAEAEQAGRMVRYFLRASGNSLRLLAGKKVWELLPPGAMDKGRAVKAEVKRLARQTGTRPVVIYLGDDVTDEKVFARLGRDDLGVHVGAGERTKARYRLAGPTAVARFLDKLAEAMR